MRGVSDTRIVLSVDVGGSHVKALASNREERRRFPSGPSLTPAEMVTRTLRLVEEWPFDVVSVGVPCPVRGGKVVAEPANLGGGWVGFDFKKAFGKPVKMVNDAAMQALGSYRGGRMLFLGLGTGLGTALIVDGVLEPMEIAHLPYKHGKTYEDYVGLRGLKRLGKKKWRKKVADVVDKLRTALEADDVVLGGGNVKKLDELPPHARLGDNANAFIGGYRLWDDAIAGAGAAEPAHRHAARA